MRHTLDADLPALSAEQDLAVYRVAQESLTNVARHARARDRRARAERARTAPSSCGSPTTAAASRELHAASTEGGVGGMRERALLAGGRLRVRALPERGTEVRLDLWPSR